MIKRLMQRAPRSIGKRLLRNLTQSKLGITNKIIASPNLPFRTAALAQIGMRPIEAVPTSAGAAHYDTHTLGAPSKFSVTSPQFSDFPSKFHDGMFDPIKAYFFENITASAYSPGLAGVHQLFLPSQLLFERDRIVTDEGGIFRTIGRGICATSETDLDLDSGIHVGGAGAFNWYHFVVECLPKAFLAQRLPAEYDDVPLILPEECRTVQSFSDSMKAVANGRPLRYLSRTQRARFRRLIVFDEISFGPFNMRAGEWPRVSDYSQHDVEVKAFLSSFRKSILSDWAPDRQNRRIFLARPGTRRRYNQEELIRVAAQYGFEPVFPEQLSLHDQAQLFAESEMIIGPSGAAWVGMLFCSRPIVGLSWLPSAYREFCSYSTLAHLLGHQLTFVEARPEHELRSTGEAYEMSYEVCPLEFERVLHNLRDGAPT